MVEQLPHHLKVEDSSPASAGGTGKDTMAKNELSLFTEDGIDWH